MTQNVRKLANTVLNRYHLSCPSLDDVVSIILDYGYEIIDLDPQGMREEIIRNSFMLPKEVFLQAAFVYIYGDVKVVFVKDTLSTQEKLYALSHELAHIVLEHSYKSITVLHEYEANEFVHYFLNPMTASQIRNVTTKYKGRTIGIFITIILVITIGVFLAKYYTNQTYTEYYVTTYGKKYHVKTCTQIVNNSNVHRLSRKDFEAGIYESCSICLFNTNENKLLTSYHD